MDANQAAAPCGIRVLLVDDQRIIGEAIKRLLEPEKDIVFLHCLEPSEAMKAVDDFHPDVILQDLVMPGVDGMDLVRAYKESPVLKGVSAIVLSSEEDSETRAKAFNLHADDYLVKVPHRAELVAKIRVHAEASFARRSLLASRQELERMKAAMEAASWLDAVCFAASAVVSDLEAPIQYIVGNMMFVGDAFHSLTRFRARLARLPIPPELAAAMKEAADQEELDFVFDDAPKAFRQSQAEMDRASSMIRALRQLPLSPGISASSSVDANALVNETLPFLKGRLASVADVKLSLQDGLPKVSLLREELRLAALILLASAALAVEERFGKNGQKGQIEISSSFDGSNVKISVKDNGSQVSAALAAGLFEPLSAASGSRRGLHAVKRIAEAAGGSFSLRAVDSASSAELSFPPAG